MNFAFCFGNGRSRIGIDPQLYSTIGPTYGTNHMIKDYPLTNNIVADKILLIELISLGYQNKTNLYTRKRWKASVAAKDDKILELPEPIDTPVNKWDNEIHWGSGCHAVNLAATHGANIVVMIGFDLYGIDGHSNNVYYEIKRAVDPSHWIYQLALCFDKYKNTQFVQIQSDDWKEPEEWVVKPNYYTDSLENLANLLNK